MQHNTSKLLGDIFFSHNNLHPHFIVFNNDSGAGSLSISHGRGDDRLDPNPNHLFEYSHCPTTPVLDNKLYRSGIYFPALLVDGSF